MTVGAYIANGEFDITPSDQTKFLAFGVYTKNDCVLKYQCKNGYIGTRTLLAGDTLPMAIVKIFASGSSGTLTGLTGYVL
jgi:hypothetical protein